MLLRRFYVQENEKGEACGSGTRFCGLLMRSWSPAPVPQRKKHRELKTAILPILGGPPVANAAQELPSEDVLGIVDEVGTTRAGTVV